MSRTLDVHIRNIRRKLEEGGAENIEIATLRGRGYRIE